MPLFGSRQLCFPQVFCSVVLVPDTGVSHLDWLGDRRIAVRSVTSTSTDATGWYSSGPDIWHVGSPCGHFHETL